MKMIEIFKFMYLTGYSVGAMYLVVQKIEIQRENAILVAIMPGTKEPKLTMNSFLHLLVEESKEFWSSVIIPCPSHPLKIYLYCTKVLSTQC